MSEAVKLRGALVAVADHIGARITYTDVHVEVNGAVIRVPRARRAVEHHSDRLSQCRHLHDGEQSTGGARIDARMPEGLCRIDVSQAGHQSLIEQCRLDGPTTLHERLAEQAGRPRRVGRIGAEGQVGMRAGCVQLEGAERARIDKDQAGVIGELENGPGPPRILIRDPSIRPFSVHPEVRMQQAPIGEVHQLVLAAAFNAYDSRALQCASSRRRERALHGRVQRADPGNGATHDVAAQGFQRRFDLWKLWHGVGMMWTA